MADIQKKYVESKYSKLYHNVQEKFFKNNEFVIERLSGNTINGNIRVLQYNQEYDSFTEIVTEEMHHDLFTGFQKISDDQFKRTIVTYQNSSFTYLWVFVRDRLGEIWQTEEDIEKIEEIIHELDKL